MGDFFHSLRSATLTLNISWTRFEKSAPNYLDSQNNSDLTSKTFKLFVSSTFSDFKIERELLQFKVFPAIKKHCESLGFTFQPIDLRWGISNEAQFNHKTIEICLNEVKACKLYPPPNFLIMVGDRYGWVPLPYIIEKKEFDVLLQQMLPQNQEFCREWYLEDLNQVPPSFILKERTGSYKRYKEWQVIETKLRGIFQDGTKTANFSKTQRSKYFRSATKAEIVERIIDHTIQGKEVLSNTHSIFGFILSELQSPSEETQDYKSAQKLKQFLKANLHSENIFQFEYVRAEKAKIVPSYIGQLEENITHFLKKKIDNYVNQNWNDVAGTLNKELEEQAFFLKQKVKHFFGRKATLRKIQDYIDGENPHPLILSGKSGIGKSALMAQVIQKAKRTRSKKVVFRFVGATSKSSSLRSVLLSISEELGLFIEIGQSSFSETERENIEILSQAFSHALLKFQEEVIIFIDAVDHFINNDSFLWLPYQLPKNIKIILSVLKDEDFLSEIRFYNNLSTKNNNIINLPPFQEPLALLRSLLAVYNRKLQAPQEEYILSCYQRIGTPLYITIVAEEARHWKSTTTGQLLAQTQRGIVEEYFQNLHERYFHNSDLVEKVLSYIYLSKDGLSESEMLDLIATNTRFVQKIAPETWHRNPTQELPHIIWTRLYTMLQPFLAVRRENGRDLLYFFHREFNVVVRKIQTIKQEKVALLNAVQHKIKNSQNVPFHFNRWGKLHIRLLDFNESSQEMKERVDFVSALPVMDWKIQYTRLLTALGDDSSRYNNHNHAGYYRNYLLNLVNKLYQENKEQWVEQYIKALIDLGATFMSLNNYKRANQLCLPALQFVEKKYLEDKIFWFNSYMALSNLVSMSYSLLNKKAEALSMREQLVKEIESINFLSEEKYKDYYAGILSLLSESYSDEKNYEKALSFQKKSFEVKKGLYEQGKLMGGDRNYILALNNLAHNYSQLKEFKKAIEVQKKVVQKTEDLYKNDPEAYILRLVVTHQNLSQFYRLIGEEDIYVFYQEQAIQNLESHFYRNPNKYADRLNQALVELSFYYKYDRKNNKQLELTFKGLPLSDFTLTVPNIEWVKTYRDHLLQLLGDIKESHGLEKANSYAVRGHQNILTLYTNHPDLFLRTLICTKLTLGSYFDKYEDYDQSLLLYAETMDLFETLSKSQTEFWEDVFIKEYLQFCKVLQKVSSFSGALQAADRARQLVDQKHARLNSMTREIVDSYLEILRNMTICSEQTGNLKLAILCKKTAIDMQKLLCEDNTNFDSKEQYWKATIDYIQDLSKLSQLFESVEDMENAISTEENCMEFLQLKRELLQDQWAVYYTDNLNRLSVYLFKDKQLEKRINILEQCVDAYELLHKKDPKWKEHLVSQLNQLHAIYKEQNLVQKMDDVCSRLFKLNQHR